METSDKESIIKIKQGQIDNFAYLVKKYSASIYRFVALKIKRKEDVEKVRIFPVTPTKAPTETPTPTP